MNLQNTFQNEKYLRRKRVRTNGLMITLFDLKLKRQLLNSFPNNMKICRRETFNAAHRLFVAEWTDEKNFQVFGKCSNPNYHGHNYILETWIEGEIDPQTGYVFDLGELKKIIHSKVTDRFDHRNLNLDCPEFEGINPTAENIAKVIWQILRKELDSKYQITIKLWETEKNSVEYAGE